MKARWVWAIAGCLVAAVGGWQVKSAVAQVLGTGAAVTSTTAADIRNTRHNLSSSAPTRTATDNPNSPDAVVTSGTSQICVFCHTPHGANNAAPGAPLWNRPLGATTSYTGYTSSSLDSAADIDVSDGVLATPSKLCLSCHDGTVALGNVSNAPGAGMTGGIPGVTGAGAGEVMPSGRGENTGFTRKLGKDLRNDHPISMTYDASLATTDGELRSPSMSSTPKIANRATGQKPELPLTDGRVQCSTCHDPHKKTQKFLNKNRLVQSAVEDSQNASPNPWTDWSFSDQRDQICMACHTRLGKAWALSAHANSGVGTYSYNSAEAALREFPAGTTVWKAGCLNCHDTHTVAGSRRLLREGVETGGTGTQSFGSAGSASFRLGSSSGDDYNTMSALENTCYQCHQSSPVIGAGTLSASAGVPDIKTEFGRNYRMPITNGDQGDPSAGNTFEVHDITNADTEESPLTLGLGTPENRHVECTDCHNPHRVVKADTILGAQLSGGVTTRRTHVPARGTTGEQGNIASGALRGAWGVEPSYTATGQTTVTSSTVWMSPSEVPTFTVKKGDPANASTLPVGTAGTNAVSYLTREYQLCFKCHSNYANGPLATDFPTLKTTNTRGTTASGTNRMTRYTNVAQEFAVLAKDPPESGTHQGEQKNDSNGTDSSPVSTVCNNADCVPVGASWDTTPGASTINHRSWHPVVFPTGRNGAERGDTGFANMRPPFDTASKIGKQTMHCSDCHGMSTSWSQSPNGPDLTKVQGPHGSDKPFLLKGDWGTASNPNYATTNLSNVTDGTELCGNCHFPVAPNNAALKSGFAGDHQPDGNMSGLSCTRCHVAVPHGWKNKAFLVNKSCVGKEGGELTDCEDRMSFTSDFNRPPYYLGARNAFKNWRKSRDSEYTVYDNTCTGNESGARKMQDCVKSNP